jgi:diguanylate cyclase (GGDEF)-like protein/PAS domain S-box-containing protein
MPTVSKLNIGRRLPSLQVVVPILAAGLVVAAAFAVSTTVASQQQQTGIDASVRAVDAVVHGYVDPLLANASLADPVDPSLAAAVNRQLQQLTASGKLLRIKIWRPDGTIVFSDLPALRGRHFEVEDDLQEALDGETATAITPPDADENVFERELTPLVLEIYTPIGGRPGRGVIGAYEVYQDARPLQASIDATRRDVLLIVGALGLVLLALLWGAFRGANRLLTELAARLRRSEARFRSLVQNSTDLVLVVDAEGTTRYVSPAIGAILGEPSDSWADRSLPELVHPEDADWMRAALARLAADRSGTHSGEVRVRHADGRWRWLEVVGSNRLADPEVGGIVLNCRDITERRELEDQLRRQAFTDPLTGLPNRPLLLDRLAHDLAARATEEATSSVMAVALIDLDDVKSINDSLGHAAGDRLLIEVAERLQHELAAPDTAARLGGDEFALLLHAASRESIDAAMGRLLGRLRETLLLDGQSVSPSASVGIAFPDRSERSAEETLRNADVAMHTAKMLGKGRRAIYAPHMREAAVRRLTLREDLAQALERGELTIHYQPILDLASNEVVAVEALARWERPSGMVGPTEFIPIAEETGLIVPIGRWVLETACREIHDLDAAQPGRELRVSVNVSTVQLEREDFAHEVSAVLHETGLAPGRLILELTESLLLERSEPTLASMRRIRQLGVRLAIDDFGTGYSSLSYLPELPVDMLKIDRSFVAGLDSGRETLAVVRSIIRLSATLGLVTLAEGIERPEQAARLRTIGAELGQGYYFARPLTTTQLSAYLAGDASEAAGAAG